MQTGPAKDELHRDTGTQFLVDETDWAPPVFSLSDADSLSEAQSPSSPDSSADAQPTEPTPYELYGRLCAQSGPGQFDAFFQGGVLQAFVRAGFDLSHTFPWGSGPLTAHATQVAIPTAVGSTVACQKRRRVDDSSCPNRADCHPNRQYTRGTFRFDGQQNVRVGQNCIEHAPAGFLHCSHCHHWHELKLFLDDHRGKDTSKCLYCMVDPEIAPKIKEEKRARAAAGIAVLVAAGQIAPLKDGKCPCKQETRQKKAPSS